MRLSASALACLLLAGALPAAAQAGARPLTPGMPVRVSPTAADAAPGWVEGIVILATPDSLVMSRFDTGRHDTFRRDEIGALQASVGRRTRGENAGRYALIGGGAGALTGALLGGMSFQDDGGETWGPGSRAQAALVGAVALGLPGVLIGVLAGGASPPGERWAPATLAGATTVAVRPDGGVGVGLSLRL